MDNPNNVNEPNMSTPNPNPTGPENASGAAGNIYYDATAGESIPVPPQKKKGGKTVIIIIIVLIVLLLCCCCGIPGVYAVIAFIQEYQASQQAAYKPVIYLYPEEKTEVSVKVSDPDLFTVTYPDYRDCWKVTADSDGTLTDPDTLRTYYSLYYESELPVALNFDGQEGFLVAGEDTATFLEDKLSTLGLTDREAEEMIIYWLPELSGNDYNLIRFASQEEIDECMQLNICPQPDSVIRIWMVFQDVDADEAAELKDTISEPELVTPSRDGFTVVEWGGVRVE